MNTSIRATVPGNLMLMGEHAVLHGKQALACAVTDSMRVILKPRTDTRIRIFSDLGECETEVSRIHIVSPFRFVLTGVAHFRDRLPSGFDLHIESDFSDDVGYGSSAAVPLGTQAVLSAWMGEPADPDTLFQKSLAVVRAVQGRGSGADVAASAFGGMVAYRMEPVTIEPLRRTHPITVVYSGYKKPTVQVIEQVESSRARHPALFDGLFDLIDAAAREAVDAVRREDWAAMGRLMNIQQGFMEALGVADRTLSRMVYTLREQPGIQGAKISGAGLGDCVVGLGRFTNPDYPYQTMNTNMNEAGLRID